MSEPPRIMFYICTENLPDVVVVRTWHDNNDEAIAKVQYFSQLTIIFIGFQPKIPSWFRKMVRMATGHTNRMRKR